MKYKVKVIETLVKVVNIEAESPRAAKEIAERMWLDEEIELNTIDDHDNTEIHLINNEY